jgi:hypothetical protein
MEPAKLPHGLEISTADGDALAWHIAGVGPRGDGIHDVVVVAPDRNAARRVRDELGARGWARGGGEALQQEADDGLYLLRVVTDTPTAARRTRLSQILDERPALASQVEGEARQAWTESGGDVDRFHDWLRRREGELVAHAEVERFSSSVADASDRHRRQLARYMNA